MLITTRIEHIFTKFLLFIFKRMEELLLMAEVAKGIAFGNTLVVKMKKQGNHYLVTLVEKDQKVKWMV